MTEPRDLEVDALGDPFAAMVALLAPMLVYRWLKEAPDEWASRNRFGKLTYVLGIPIRLALAGIGVTVGIFFGVVYILTAIPSLLLIGGERLAEEYHTRIYKEASEEK